MLALMRFSFFFLDLQVMSANVMAQNQPKQDDGTNRTDVSDAGKGHKVDDDEDEDEDEDTVAVAVVAVAVTFRTWRSCVKMFFISLRNSPLCGTYAPHKDTRDFDETSIISDTLKSQTSQK
jgi:hypothetical protein